MGLRFGTSGVRGLVTELTDEACAVYGRAFARFLAARGTDPRLDRKQAYYVLEAEDTADVEPLELRPARETDIPAVVRAHRNTSLDNPGECQIPGGVGSARSHFGGS